MPIAPRFHVEHVHDLALQMTRSSKSIRKSQIKSTENLLKEIEENSLYPFDYLVYRITGYRAHAIDQPMLLGSALLGDLVALIAIVSRSLPQPAEGMMDVQQVSNKLGVSLRTLSRLRHEGLVFHWVSEKTGHLRLGCSVGMLNDFAQRNKERIQRASQFSRLSFGEQQEIVNIAMTLDDKTQTLSEAASAVAKQSPRGHETIRMILQRSEVITNTYHQPKQIKRKDARDIERAIQKGTSWSELKERYQRSIGAMRKALTRLRATRSKKWDIPFIDLDVFERPDAEEVILGSPAAYDVNPPMLVLDSLEFNRETYNLDNEETAVVSAMQLLRRRASTQSKRLDYNPTEKILDRIETDLRWSFLLQQLLIIQAMPASLSVLVQHVGRPLHELPAIRLVPLVKQLIQVVGNACGELNPSKGQTAGKTPAAVLDRHLSLIDLHPKPLQASAKYKAIELKAPFHEVVPWFDLIPKEDYPSIANRSSSELRDIVALRYGWQGKPRTIHEIAKEMGTSSLWVKRQLRVWK
jgi:RNA polymerase primary sigma factor